MLLGRNPEKPLRVNQVNRFPAFLFQMIEHLFGQAVHPRHVLSRQPSPRPVEAGVQHL